jgi:hypothetical protein
LLLSPQKTPADAMDQAGETQRRYEPRVQSAVHHQHYAPQGPSFSGMSLGTLARHPMRLALASLMMRIRDVWRPSIGESAASAPLRAPGGPIATASGLIDKFSRR